MTTDLTPAYLRNRADVLDAWLAGVQAHVNQHRDGVTLAFDAGGKKYIRVVEEYRVNGVVNGRSVFAFIEVATGAILKADSWKRPAKGVRGYVTDKDYSIGRGVSCYGGTYRYR